MSSPLRLGFTVICLVLLTAGCVVSPLWSQDPPATDIWLFDIEAGDETTEGVPKLAGGRNLTDRQGYDNQPMFLPSADALLYTSIADGQADIYRYDLGAEAAGEKRVAKQLTSTPESEYSPTPLADGSGFSVVRVEEDGRQRLWKFSMSGAEPTLLLPDVEPVGYHAWGDNGEVVLFVLGEPNSLHLAKLGVAGSQRLAADIGRALARIPDQDAFSFLHKVDGQWWVKRLPWGSEDSGSLQSGEPLIAALPGREDVAWAPDGMLWGADGGKVYRWCPFCGSRWQLVADLELSHGLDDITRLAIDRHGRRLALVAARGPSPAAE